MQVSDRVLLHISALELLVNSQIRSATSPCTYPKVGKVLSTHISRHAAAWLTALVRLCSYTGQPADIGGDDWRFSHVHWTWGVQCKSTTLSLHTRTIVTTHRALGFCCHIEHWHPRLFRSFHILLVPTVSSVLHRAVLTDRAVLRFAHTVHPAHISSDPGLRQDHWRVRVLCKLATSLPCIELLC